MVQAKSGANEDVNPIPGEAQQLNEADNEIVQEIAALDQQEGAEEAPAPAAQETPPETPPPPQEPVVSPHEDVATLRRQLEEQQRLNEQLQAQQQQQSLDSAARQYQAQLEAQGWVPEQAQAAANERRQAVERELQLRQQGQRQQAILEGKMNAALFFSEKYGVPARSLMRYNDPESMEEAAKQASRIAALEKEVRAGKKAQVPPQRFASNQQTAAPPSSERQWLSAYNNGDRSPQAVAAAKKAAGY